jgi:hypothetical protein
MRPRLLAAAVAILPACGTYATNRAALVPHATPMPTDGQPIASQAEVQLGATNASDLRAPGVGNPDDAVEVPNTQLHGGLDVRINRVVSLGVQYERGLAAGAHPIHPTQPRVDHGDAQGLGESITLALPMDEHFFLGVSTEVMLWSVPWVQYSTCIAGCDQPVTGVTRDNHDVWTFAIGVTPSYRRGAWTWFGGMTLRNHPTIVEKTIEHAGEVGPGVERGPGNFTVHAGAELDVGAGVRAGVILAQTLTRDPVAYGPSVGLLVTIPFGALPPSELAAR